MVLINFKLVTVIYGILTMLHPGAVQDEKERSMFSLYSKTVQKNCVRVLGEGTTELLVMEDGKEYFLHTSTEERKNYCVISSAKGRNDYFDYMAILDNNLALKDISILKYRSEYGYEIESKSWLRQFYGKPDVVFVYRKNIDVISGASYSAPSLVNDINVIINRLKRLE